MAPSTSLPQRQGFPSVSILLTEPPYLWAVLFAKELCHPFPVSAGLLYIECIALLQVGLQKSLLWPSECSARPLCIECIEFASGGLSKEPPLVLECSAGLLCIARHSTKQKQNLLGFPSLILVLLGLHCYIALGSSGLLCYMLLLLGLKEYPPAWVCCGKTPGFCFGSFGLVLVLAWSKPIIYFTQKALDFIEQALFRLDKRHIFHLDIHALVQYKGHK